MASPFVFQSTCERHGKVNIIVMGGGLILEGGGVPTADAENSASSRVSREP